MKVSTYEEKGEQYEVHVRADEQLPRRPRRPRAADRAFVPARLGAARRRGRSRAAPRAPPDQPPQPAPAGHLPGQRRRRASARARSPTALAKILDENLPAGYAAAPLGRSKEMGRAAQSFLVAFGLSFIFMYLILAAQFESWLHPITILLCAAAHAAVRAPLAAHLRPGARHLLGARHPGALRRGEEELDPPDRPHQPAARRRACRGSRPSSHANKDRLRPILMTTLAFVAGMIPLVMSSGIGAGFNRATPASWSAGRRCRCCSRCWRRRSPTRCSTTRPRGSSAAFGARPRTTTARARSTRSTRYPSRAPPPSPAETHSPSSPKRPEVPPPSGRFPFCCPPLGCPVRGQMSRWRTPWTMGLDRQGARVAKNLGEPRTTPIRLFTAPHCSKPNLRP